MGDLIRLPVGRMQRAHRSVDPSPTFFFDVSDPLSYLMGEQVERSLGAVHWVAVDGTALGDRVARQAGLREHAEARARALRLPLVWPDTFPAGTPRALRAAAFACEIGAGPQFALAAGRLAFCGGFDLEEPTVLAEAAAAAGIPLDGCTDAAGERWRDAELGEMVDLLRARDIFELPAVTIGGRWFSGDAALQLAGAVAAEPGRAGERGPQVRSYRRPLAPVG